MNESTSTDDRIGVVEHYYPRVHAAVIRLDRGAIREGDVVRIVGHGHEIEEPVTSLELEHRPVHEGHPGERIGLLVDFPVNENDQVYRVHA